MKYKLVDCAHGLATMVRSLSQWTKTLSFPSRLSPNRTSKESVVNVQPGSPGVSPTPSASSLPQSSEKTISPIPITEISQIVSDSRIFKGILPNYSAPSPFANVGSSREIDFLFILDGSFNANTVCRQVGNELCNELGTPETSQNKT